jgi:hypothetical protein
MRGELERARQELTEILTGTPEGAALLPARSALIETELQRGAVSEADRWLELQSSSTSIAHVGDGLRIEIQLDYCLVDVAAGRGSDALCRLTDVEEAALATGNRELVVRAVIVTARAALSVGDLEAAEAAAQRAVSTAQAGTSREFQVDAIAVQAEVACGLGNWDAVHALTERGLKLAQDAGLRHPECELLVLAGRAKLGLNSPRDAARLARSARDLADQCGYVPLVTKAQEVLDRASGTHGAA